MLRRYFGIDDHCLIGAVHCPATPEAFLTVALLNADGTIISTHLANGNCMDSELPASCGFRIPLPAEWLDSDSEQPFSFRIMETGVEFPQGGRCFRRSDLATDPTPAAETVAVATESAEWLRGRKFATDFQSIQLIPTSRAQPVAEANALEGYFEANTEGNGIWKWRHYFEIYHRHLAKFINQNANLMEVGIYSGGSFGMWLNYLGPTAHIYGVDIEDACRSYAQDRCSIFIGDQADRAFWQQVREQVPALDVLIDDGGHTPEQQMVTLEEMLPHLAPGGVYICEDVHGDRNVFADFVAGLVSKLHAQVHIPGPTLASSVNELQAWICSVHWYPYLVVIEKHATRCDLLEAPKRGTAWQPFL